MKWTNEITEEVIKMYRSGYKMKEISDKTGFGEKAISNKLSKLRKEGIEVKRWWKV